jgi:hypothetical protein
LQALRLPTRRDGSGNYRVAMQCARVSGNSRKLATVAMSFFAKIQSSGFEPDLVARADRANLPVEFFMLGRG